jgi:hypothetical protein
MARSNIDRVRRMGSCRFFLSEKALDLGNRARWQRGRFLSLARLGSDGIFE